MTPPTDERDEAETAETTETPWQRRRRLEAVFGDVLPETTDDERDGADRPADGAATDRWLKEQVPPHHG